MNKDFYFADTYLLIKAAGFTVETLAEHLEVTPQTVQHWIKKNYPARSNCI